VQWFDDIGTNQPQVIKIRALVIEGHVKEYAVVAPQEVPERLFVVRRASAVNDSVPEDSGTAGSGSPGLAACDRMTGQLSPINLQEFDVLYSAASWYRDYVAHCGGAEDGN
jgi:hypothetical protein